jgi:hypothetical protein
MNIEMEGIWKEAVPNLPRDYPGNRLEELSKTMLGWLMGVEFERILKEAVLTLPRDYSGNRLEQWYLTFLCSPTPQI